MFTINDIIEYNPAEGTLLLISTGDITTLQLPANRLMVEIINSHGKILSRDYLLTEVWDKYGLTSSNANLNQYLSLLRRSLAALGCPDFIVTIPKAGIRLSEAIVITAHTTSVEENELPVNVDDQLVLQLPSPAHSHVTPAAVKDDSRLGRGLIVLSILLLVISAGLYSSQNRLVTPELFKSSLEGGCEIITLRDKSQAELSDINKQAEEIMNDNKLSCHPGIRIYIDSSKSGRNHQFGRTLLSYCNVGTRGSNTPCQNIYFLDWGGDEK